MKLMTMSELAPELGTTVRQVHAWYSRRANSGFPEARGYDVHPNGKWVGRKHPLFDLEEVKAWKRDYVPKKGGAGFHKKNQEAAA